MTTPLRPRLRWYQYSLRSLFVLTVLVAIGGSWFAWKKQQVERQRAAVKAIKELGGEVLYDWQSEYISSLSGTMFTAIAMPEAPGPAWLRAWLGDDFFAHVDYVGLNHTQVTDADLACLGALPRLKQLYLTDSRVTDAGLQQVRTLERLERLEIRNTKVTDEGVKRLNEALPNCTIVRRGASL